jgi:hypothetical protein
MSPACGNNGQAGGGALSLGRPNRLRLCFLEIVGQSSPLLLSTFRHFSTVLSNQLAPAQPVRIPQLPPAPFECRLSNSQNY